MNMLLVACGDTALLVDAGVMFPEPELFGVDLVIPDLVARSTPIAGRIAALVLTHGHEDHIGAIAARDRPRRRPGLRHRRSRWRSSSRSSTSTASTPRDRLVAVAPRQIGDGRAVPRSSSCASRTASRTALALAIHTPAGTIVHTGDFKIDQTPLDGEPFDLHRFAELGARRASWRCSPTARTPTGAASPAPSATSSTASRRSSAARPARSSSRRSRRASTACSCSSTWPSSSIARSRSSAAACSRPRRLPSGSGYLRIPPGLQIRDSDVRDYPPRGRRCACAPARRASRWRPCPGSPSTTTGTSKLAPDDVVVFSARVIPGQREGDRPGHEPRRPAGRRHRRPTARSTSTSPGHGSAEELKLRHFPRQAAVLRADTW